MFGFAVVLFSIFALVNSVFAGEDVFGMKITGDSSQDEKTIFDLNEIPWLYIDLKKGDTEFEGWWKPLPGTDSDQKEISALGPEGEIIWKALTDWSWVTPATVGDYIVHAKGYGNTSFTVTPEPISSVLFLLGGATLGLGFYRRKRKKT